MPRQPDWDIDQELGSQSELWVSDVRRSLAEKGTVEVKHDKPFLKNQHCYVEYECRGRDGKWRKSGIATTRASIYIFTFGSLPGGLIVATDWLKRAARRAFRRPSAKAQLLRGSNPTRAVLVSIADLWATRDHEP
jgi:hypothetical protein